MVKYTEFKGSTVPQRTASCVKVPEAGYLGSCRGA